MCRAANTLGTSLLINSPFFEQGSPESPESTRIQNPWPTLKESAKDSARGSQEQFADFETGNLFPAIVLVTTLQN